MAAGGFALLLLMTLSGPALASNRQAVVIYDRSLASLATRIAWELTSDGFHVRPELQHAGPSCSSPDSSPAMARTVKQVWIRIGRTVDSPPAWCAVITVSGPAFGLRQTRIDSAIGNVKGFALAVAEAVNGLSIQALAPGDKSDVAEPASASRPATRSAHSEASEQASMGASANVLLDTTHPQPMVALGLLGELPLNDLFSLQVDNAWTVTRLRFKEGETELMARILWTRLSLAVEVLPGPANLRLLAGAGPAFTWATARVPPPDAARADIGVSAIFSVGGQLMLRITSSLHMGALVRASSLLPSVRLQLPSGPSSPYGRLIGEAGTGLFVRW